MPSTEEAQTGVDQGTISKVLNGKRRRANDRLRILDQYGLIQVQVSGD